MGLADYMGGISRYLSRYLMFLLTLIKFLLTFIKFQNKLLRMGTPVNSTDSLISQKRKTTKIPNYGSNGSAMSVNASIASGYQSLNKNENDLRDHQYDYLWKVSASRTVLDFESFWLKISRIPTPFYPQFICVGNCNVGKSSVLNLYKNHYFNPEDARPTPGLALVETRVSLNTIKYCTFSLFISDDSELFKSRVIFERH